MKLRKRKNGSQREGKASDIKFWPNLTGQGGEPHLMFRDQETGEWIWIEFETEEEVRELLSQAHIVHHNFEEPVDAISQV